MLPEIPADEYAAVLDACVESVLWEAGATAPPVDAIVVAGRLGLTVAEDVGLTERARFVRLSDQNGHGHSQATIVVGPAERPEREQWAIAHEIGESVAYRVFASLGVDVASSPLTARELVANHLAGRLLIPGPWFAADASEVGWDLLALKNRYTTASHELIARRMLEMHPPIVITVCDNGRICWRRRNAATRPPKMFADELAAWREAHSTGMPSGNTPDPCSTGLESVRCWPIHEPGWKREILRSAIAEI